MSRLALLRVPRDPDLRAAVVAALLAAVAVTTVPQAAVRLVCTLPLGLFLPGFVLRSAIFPAARLELSARLMLIPALSLAVLVFGALFLDVTGVGLWRWSWALFLLSVVAAGATLAQSVRDRPRDRTASAAPITVVRALNRGDMVVIAVVLAVVVGAVVASRIPLSNAHVVGYTRLWATEVAPRKVQFTGANDRRQAGSFELVVSLARKAVMSRRLRLRAGAEYRASVVVPPSPVPMRVTGELFATNGTRALPEAVHPTLAPQSRGSR
ncbi:MAG: DUF1616 domain-containing protein [Solirubrobacterales bacterium]|nr:DUF1616 domain-containing protein [Solirubrobacterales bacterium]